MSFLSSALVAMLLCGMAAPSLALDRTASFPDPSLTQQLRDQTPCDTCLAIVQDIEDYIELPGTEDTVVTFIQDNFCTLLPKDSSRTCNQEARVLVAQAIASLEQNLPPQTVCSYLGTCGTGELLTHLYQAIGLNTLSAQGFPVECPVCKLIMANILQKLHDPDSRADIEKAATEACDDLAQPEEVVKCKADVVQLFASLDALLGDMDAGRACKVLQFCGSSSDSSISSGEDGDAMTITTTTPLPSAIAALRQLPHRLQDIPANGNSDGCEACKSVITEASQLLVDPETQKEIFDFAKQGCEAFDDYKDMCVEYVDQYGPLVIGMAISYLQPEPFCARLGYCPATPTARR